MKQVKVLNHPETFILVDDNKDEEQAKVEWQKRYNRQNLSNEQKRREHEIVRGGKVMQRIRYKNVNK